MIGLHLFQLFPCFWGNKSWFFTIKIYKILTKKGKIFAKNHVKIVEKPLVFSQRCRECPTHFLQSVAVLYNGCTRPHNIYFHVFSRDLSKIWTFWDFLLKNQKNPGNFLEKSPDKLRISIFLVQIFFKLLIQTFCKQRTKAALIQCRAYALV